MKRRKKLLPGWLVVLLDVLAIGAALCVFSLFHHVLPQAGGDPVQTIVDISHTDTADTTPVESADDATSSNPIAAVPIVQYKIGDFSATFPNYDTGTGKKISYQTNDVRIAIDEITYENSVCFIADVWVRNITSLQTAFGKDTYGKSFTEPVAKIANDHDASLAMTGDFYGTHSSGVVIRNGKLYRDNLYDDVCVIYLDGTMEAFLKGTFDIDKAIARGAYQAWSFGPPLLNNGQFINGFTHTLAPANPRAAIGYYEPGHYAFVVVDGRQSGYSKGLTFTQLSKLFSDLGCRVAYNLDGGESAVMTYNGDMVNKPYKNGRNVSDIVYITK